MQIAVKRTSKKPPFSAEKAAFSISIRALFCRSGFSRDALAARRRG
ncbi:hypothetical protein [Xanthomonas bundabergensis]